MDNSNSIMNKEIKYDNTVIEELDTGVYYKGKGKITNGKFTVINLPKNTDKIVIDFVIKITPIYSNQMHEHVYIDPLNHNNPNVYPLFPSEVHNNSFIVYGPNADFFWVATGKYKNIDSIISSSVPKKKGSTFKDRLEDY